MSHVRDMIEEEDDEDDDMMDHNNEKNIDADMDHRDEVENKNKFVLSNLNLKQNRNNDRSSKKVLQQVEEEKEEVVQDEEIAEENSEVSELDQKTKMINATASKRRSFMIFTSLSIIMVFSTYFIIAYFLAMKTFETASQVV